MDKWRVKIISRVLDAVKLNFPATIQFIEDCLEQDCSKKKQKITVEVAIFLFTCLEAKSCQVLKQKRFHYF